MYNETEYRVIFADTDAMGIVYNGTYISMFERGRTELMRQMGYPYKRMEEEGMKLPVGSITCTYLHPAFADDLLVIRSWVDELKAASIYIGYEVYKKETSEVCVTGSSMHPVTDTELKPVKFNKVRPDLYEMIKKSMDDDDRPKKRLKRR